VPGSSLKSPSGTGTAGRLSGDYPELYADLDFHENNFMAQGSFIAEGMVTAAQIFQQSPVDGRKRALIIIADGQIMDTQLVASAQQSLAAVKVEVFGAIVRRFSATTPADITAEQYLKPLTSSPQDTHFVNMEMDKFISSEGPLHTICDSSSDWGQYLSLSTAGVAKPCRENPGKVECNLDPGCLYSDTLLACTDSKCLQHCTEQDCKADTDNQCAVWDAAKQVCYRQPECNLQKAPCDANTECVWNTAADPDRCEDRPCKHYDESSCLGDDVTRCEWTSLTNKCESSRASTSRCRAPARARPPL
jgi:hypothetical protein